MPTFDRQEYTGKVAELQERRVAAQMPAIHLLQRAAPIMNEVMTGSEAWNHYLTVLQGYGERLTAARDRAMARLAAPDVWSAESLLKLKADVLVCNSQIELLQFAISLPKAIIDGSKSLDDIVAKFEAKHAESAGQVKP